ncbi:hypothetical protein BH760_gp69 [Gordonia phage Splinter]|uniref:Uncharacterized protein n=2 Tax=Vendettavirus vendetta TaxID=2049886 RepID=A0A160DD36_9CAUD|nr:hypothetical protein BH795_gp69 [Gordonia phage Vendetta]YP_009275396.1 hypothetical protein BH760_gp69 [Gordonia phage Splinter]ANA85589.1 hypothetical protein PBI_VENDETTA_42 [Gordonia phage Vendetta]ANA85668.1 hypothetical protein PBI_SPLINTER_42 [Gordonia phage Splinter]
MNDHTVPVPARVLVNAIDALSTLVLDVYADEPIPFVPTWTDELPDGFELPEGLDEPATPAEFHSAPAGDDVDSDDLLDSLRSRLGLDPEPAEFGVYRDRVGDVWRHTPDGWQPIESSDGQDVTHLTIETSWCPEVANCGPFELVDTEPASFSLAEAAHQLAEQGIDTGRNRLYRYLNEGIAWTDGEGSPRPAADGYLIVAEPASGSRSAVVRVTPEGVAALARVMGSAL